MSEEARILVVDDEPKICQFLKVLLEREGLRVSSACRAAEAIEMFEEDAYDLVITDLKMPGMDGFELVKRLKAIESDTPVVMITGYATVETAVQALRHGVDDYITKPFNIEELRKVIARSLQASTMERENRSLLERLERANAELKKHEETLAAAEASGASRGDLELEERCLGVLKALAGALEAKDQYLRGHSQRVTDYACALGRALDLGAGEMELLRTAGRLHDLGKISVNDTILDKPKPLTGSERNRVEDHPSVGEQIVGPLEFLKPVQPLIRHHHERMDGKGYPDRLEGTDIPRLARILAVADAFDAMTSRRPWRPAMTAEEAATEIRSCAGVQFDRELADVFCAKGVSRRFTGR